MSAWRHMIRLGDLARGPLSVTLEPDAETRTAIAKELALEGLPALQGRITARPWLDGAEISGRFNAVVEQICGVTLDPFETQIDGLSVNGVDIIRWNAAGRIVEFKVMIRPLKAVNLIHERMAAMLAARQAG